MVEPGQQAPAPAGWRRPVVRRGYAEQGHAGHAVHGGGEPGRLSWGKRDEHDAGDGGGRKGPGVQHAPEPGHRGARTARPGRAIPGACGTRAAGSACGTRGASHGALPPAGPVTYGTVTYDTVSYGTVSCVRRDPAGRRGVPAT